VDGLQLALMEHFFDEPLAVLIGPAGTVSTHLV
jgi:hypothetical protein